jgi:hypothetical protein
VFSVLINVRVHWQVPDGTTDCAPFRQQDSQSAAYGIDGIAPNAIVAASNITVAA